MRTKNLHWQLTCVAVLLVVLPLTLAAQERNERNRGPDNRRRPDDISLLLISDGDVQRELDISPAQGELLEAIGEDLSAQRRGRSNGRGRNRSREDRNRRADIPRRLFQVVLDEEQSERLAQIGFQFKGPFAIDDDRFAKAVELGNEQLEVIRKARSKNSEMNYAQLKELLGKSSAEKWRTQLGDDFNFRGYLRRLRTAYLVELQRIDRD